jgi:hypothetical protein
MRTLAAILVLAPLLAAAPDFSGSWKMDPARTDFGMLPAPSVFERVIRHTEPKLETKTRQVGQRGETNTEASMTTDGKENSITISGRPAHVKAQWEGDTTRRETPQGEVTLIERWVLASDAKSLTITAKVVTPAGEVPLKIHLEKQ